MEKLKIWIDTDIGDDIDDALAVAYAANKDNWEIVGISTVFRCAGKRARLAKKLLKLLGCDAPVYVGYSAPISRNGYHTGYTQEDEDTERACFSPDGSVPSETVGKIAEAARRYGENFALVCIGPYTNIAKAVRLDREAFQKTKFYVMGGSFSIPWREWNVVCDLAASKTLFTCGLNLNFVGFDITQSSRLDESEYDGFTSADGTEAYEYVKLLTGQWVRACKQLPMLHDPLAMLMIDRPDLVEMRTEEILLETKGEFSKGLTLIKEKLNSFVAIKREEAFPVNICVKADMARCKQEILKVISGGKISYE